MLDLRKALWSPAAGLLLALAALPSTAQQAVPGVLDGKFSPSANGDATYQVAVDLPPGIQQAQPHLTLTYSSHAGNGRLGVGWQLDGVSAITRCDSIPAVDGVRSAVSYGPGDRFCLDGARLINVQGAYGSPGSLYRTELDTLRLVQASASLCGSAPCSFTVTTDKGATWSYGTTAGSRVLAAGRADVRVWAVAQVVDLNGNAIAFTYTGDPLGTGASDGQYYAQRIDYTANAGAAANRSVRFVYAARPDVDTRYVGGGAVVTRARLANVQTFLQETPVKDYRLTYGTGALSGRSEVTAIKVCAGTGTTAPCLPATTFAWQGPATLAYASQDLGARLPANSLQVLPLDANGDGRGDLEVLTSVSAFVVANTFLSTGATLAACAQAPQFPSATGQQILPMDVNADGRMDLVQTWTQGNVLQLTPYLRQADGCDLQAGTTFATGDPPSPARLWPMDVNGDGRTDLAAAWISGGTYKVDTYLATGAGFAAGGSARLPAGTASAIVWPMDANGDGMVDLVQAPSTATGTLSLVAYLSTGTTFGTGITSQLARGTAGTTAFWPFDVNADGIQDLLQGWISSGTLNLTPYYGDGAGRFVTGTTSRTGRGTSSLLAIWPLDANGDGRTDLAQAWSNQGKLDLLVYLNTSSGFGTGVDVGDLNASASAATWPLDVDGDGRMDLVQAWSNGQTLSVTGSLVQGPLPDLIATFADGLGGRTQATYLPMADPRVYARTGAPAPSPCPGTPAAGGSSEALAYLYRQAPAQAPFQSVGGGKMALLQQAVESNDPARNRWSYSYTTTFSYAGGLMDLAGRGWLGFGTITQLDLQTGQRSVTTKNQGFPLTGTTAAIQYQCDATVAAPDPKCPRGKTDTQLSASLTCYQPTVTAQGATTGQKVWLAQKSSVRFDTYDYGAWFESRGKTYRYDAYGNVTLESDLGYVDQAGKNLSTDDDVYTCTAYWNQTSPWRIGFPTAAKLSANPGCTATASFDAAADFRLATTAYTTDGRLNVASWSQYDNVNRVDLTTRYGYDAFGNVTSETQPGNRLTTYVFEATYRTYPQTRTSPANQQGRSLVETFGFDPRFGQQVALTDANGVTTTLCFDAFGRSTGSQGPIPTGSGMSPDASCVPALATGPAASFQAAPVVTLESLAYQDDGRGSLSLQNTTLQSWTSGSARTTRWQTTYVDGKGRAYETVVQGDPAAGNTVTCTVQDSEDHTVQESLPFFFAGTNADCAPAGGVARRWTTRSYDVYGRPTQVVQPAGAQGTETAVSTLAYSGDDVALTYAAGDPYAFRKVLTYRYFFSDRKIVQMVVPGDGNATTTYGYDRIGRLTSVVDPGTAANPNGVTNAVAYDSLDRRIRVDNPDQNTTGNPNVAALTLAYDPGNGLLATKTDAKGQTTRFTYDLLGRMVGKALADGTTVAYTYDDPAAANGQGQMTREAATQGGATLFQYDYAYTPHGERNQTRLTLPGEPSAYLTQTEYDPQSRVTSLTYPDGSVLASSYSLGNLAALTMGGVTYAAYSGYDPYGNPGGAAYGNRVTTAYRYAPTGELVGQTVTAPAGRILDSTIAWDHLAEVTAIADNLKAGGTDRSQTFTYASKRLTRAAAPGLYGTLSFGYDAAGNLTLKDGTTYSYQAHRVTSGTQGGQQVYAASYDAAGNLTARQAAGASWTFAYDARSQLTGVQRGGQTVLTVPAYDDDGRRLKKVDADGTVTVYVNVQYQVTRYPGGSVLATKVIGDAGGVVATVTTVQAGSAQAGGTGGNPAPGTLYFHRDHLGSTSLTTDGAGALQTRVVYLPYGGVFTGGSSGPDGFRAKFQGQELDEESALYYFGARYYDPATGRFLSPDSQLGDDLYATDSINRFAFAVNSPVTYVDPNGNSVWENIVGATIGVLEVVAGVAIDVLSEGALEPLGGALIGAGTNAILYSATSGGDFSWGQYGIQTGVGLVMGAVTGGFGGEAEAGLAAAEDGATALETAAAESVAADATEATAESAGAGLESGAARTADEAVEAATSDVDSLGPEAGCPNSFTAGTLVATLEGSRPIERIRVGDLVLALDPQTALAAWMPVATVYSARQREVVELSWLDEQGATGQVQTTPNHPFHVVDRGWVEAGTLAPGDRILTAEGDTLRVLALGTPTEAREVYNLEVLGFHTYFVSDGRAWVHNCPRGDAYNALDRRVRYWQDLYDNGRVRLTDTPSTLVAAYDVRTGVIAVGESGRPLWNAAEVLQEQAERYVGQIGDRGPGNTVGCCAEFDAANQLVLRGSDLRDIRFTQAIRPISDRVVPVCETCEQIFGRWRFPSENTQFDSDLR